jgi:seryl-tRNA synthetase
MSNVMNQPHGELVQYQKDLAELNQEIKEENEKLKDGNCDCDVEMFGSYEALKGSYEALKEENEKLKEENEGLAKQIHNGLDAQVKQEEEMTAMKDYWFGKGYDEAKSEFFVDKEFLDEKDEEIETLKKELVLLRGVAGEDEYRIVD